MIKVAAYVASKKWGWGSMPYQVSTNLIFADESLGDAVYRSLNGDRSVILDEPGQYLALERLPGGQSRLAGSFTVAEDESLDGVLSVLMRLKAAGGYRRL